MSETVLETKSNCNCDCSKDTELIAEKNKVNQIIEANKDRMGALMPILNEIQDSLGYLPRHAMEEVAKQLHVSLAEIYGVATFYSRFTLKPRGEHTVSVCLGTACYVKGANVIFNKLAEELKVKGSGETTADGKFTLEATRCLGCCGLAPVMMIDEDVYGKLVPEDIAGILKKY